MNKKQYYAVIDTNVIVSSLITTGSFPWQVVEAATNGSIIPVLKKEIYDEYRDVLYRNKFTFDDAKIENILEKIWQRAIFVDKVDINEVFKDQDDIIFYEVLMSSRRTNDTYLVTGNKKDFPIRSYIVSPREMVEIMQKE